MKLKPLVKKEYNIINDLTIEVEVFNNPYNFQLDELFQMAARINKKRSFLFISKVLGKHLAVNPKIPILVGNLLALRYLEIVYGIKDSRAQQIANAIQTNDVNLGEVWEPLGITSIKLPRPTTFVGFAETATALGHAVFSTFNQNAKYIHTTREIIDEVKSIINFEEEHSHATSHRVYAYNQDFFEDENEVVLVDDEITTGKTVLNIIRKIKNDYPLKRTFTVISILDWRTPEYRERYKQLEKELNIKIQTVSLIDGMVSVSGNPNIENDKTNTQQPFDVKINHIPVYHLLKENVCLSFSSTSINGMRNRSFYLRTTGRFGLTVNEQSEYINQIQTISRYIREKRKGNKTLIVGTGEFMYIPMLIATQMGPNVFFQSTTRSPIYRSEDDSYAIQQKFEFESPENDGLVNYLYNIEQNQYDEIFIIIERVLSLDSLNSLINELRKTKVSFINIVTMTEILN